MKKLLIIVSIIAGMSLHAFGQVSESPLIKEELLVKSAKQKKTGFILLGAGAVTAVVGGALFASNWCIIDCSSSNGSAASTGAVLLLAGAGAMIASIPVLLSSCKNAKLATQLSLNTQAIYLPLYTHNGTKSYPALELKIPLIR